MIKASNEGEQLLPGYDVEALVVGQCLHDVLDNGVLDRRVDARCDKLQGTADPDDLLAELALAVSKAE